MPFDQPINRTPIGHRRLLALAAFLETVPEAEFNMNDWGACSGHWATQMPEFRALGLQPFKKTFFGKWDDDKLWDQLEEFFGVDGAQVFAPLDADSDFFENTPADQAQRIRQFVAEQVLS